MSESDEIERAVTHFREELSSLQRATSPQLVIDPGFVNHRLIETIVGPDAMTFLDDAIKRFPLDLPDWQRPIRIGHIYNEGVLGLVRAWDIPSLRKLLNENRGRLFCSTERVGAIDPTYDTERVSTLVQLGFDYDLEVELEFSTRHISSDTLKSRLREGSLISIVASFVRLTGKRLVFEPLILGFPWLNGTVGLDETTANWNAYNFFEHFVEDIDEFAMANEVELPGDVEPMRLVSEAAFKACVGELLGDHIPNDWGGERSDYFSSHVHVNGRRMSTAFLFKGPARFAPMTLDSLGKRNDQIFRLAQEPADLLVVQHCHDIGPEVRATLRAFAVQPGRPRRYMLIDGRDSLRLLQAYGMYDRAVALSQKP